MDDIPNREEILDRVRAATEKTEKELTELSTDPTLTARQRAQVTRCLHHWCRRNDGRKKKK